MKEDKEIEKILLNDEEYEKFVNTKTEQEFIKEIEGSKSVKKEIIKDFKRVPREKVFTKDTLYLVMNKQSKTKSYINGVQAEAFLGSENILRENFLSKKTDSFVSGDNYIKFYKYKV